MIIKLTDKLYQSAIPVLEIIEQHGHEAYFVGGCVRDTLLGQAIHDIDIASSATPDEIQAIFRSTIDVGKQHGTIIVLYKSVPYEITTFRTEGKYSDCRRPDEVAFVRNLQEDTLRRDFTINALALSKNGKLLDYHNGVVDLEAKMIRAVGVAYERFDEDALRMMRAIRFASQLGFQIASETMTAIQQLAPRLQLISTERIRVELTKFLIGDYVLEALPLLVESELAVHLPEFAPLLDKLPLEQVVSGLSDKIRPLLQATLPRDERLMWAFLVQTLNVEQVERFLRVWTHSNQFIKEVQALLRIQQAYEQQAIDAWFVYQHDEALLALVADWQQARKYNYQPNVLQMKADLPIQSRKELAVNGKILMDYLQMKQGGAVIGQLLAGIEQQVVEGKLANRPEAILAQINQY
ncbi:CCA tRNA nucleotidyltransferase [Aerococcaceae bacterium NML191292]|nr:CCA tRNA nucleotidyltransferase [Aerococcaceae bacterium NML191292]MCW6682163.1 CCA tRNA nucleotidyltransferase [Aerococcaceae bacterium NML160702]